MIVLTILNLKNLTWLLTIAQVQERLTKLGKFWLDLDPRSTLKVADEYKFGSETNLK